MAKIYKLNTSGSVGVGASKDMKEKDGYVAGQEIEWVKITAENLNSLIGSYALIKSVKSEKTVSKPSKSSEPVKVETPEPDKTSEQAQSLA